MAAHRDADAQSLTVQWVLEGMAPRADGSVTSPLASSRYRALLPAGWLADQGHRVEFVDQMRWRGDQAGAADVAVLGKLPPYGGDGRGRQLLAEQVLAQAVQARAQGTAIVADFCDDHFDHPTLGPYWRGMAKAAHVCIAGSPALADQLSLHATGAVRVVGDPLASPCREPRVHRVDGLLDRWRKRIAGRGGREQRLQLIWYGEVSNWPAMQEWAELIAPLRDEQPFDLRIVTRLDDNVRAYAKGFVRRYGPRADIELLPWSEAAQWQAVEDADLVLIPVDLKDPKKAVKTGNRLTDALHVGRYVIASPLRAYLPYAEHATLTDAPLEAIRASLAQPDRTLATLMAGQQAVLASCAPATIGQAWLEALHLARSASRADVRQG